MLNRIDLFIFSGIGMLRTSSVDYERISQENLRNVLSRKELHKALKQAVENNREGSIILLETPADEYTETNTSSIGFLLDQGYEGVYMSFQRPFKNLYMNFIRNGIDVNKLFIIDCASALNDQPNENNPRCVCISNESEVDNMIQAIYNSVSNLRCKKRFVFVDSLSTMALHEPLAETIRFSEALIRRLKNKEYEDVKLLFNVAEDLTQKRYIENITVYADDYIHLGLCT